MLPQKNRIKKRKDFTRIFKNGFVVKGRFFVSKVLENNNIGCVRCAFVFSAKKEKRASKRNRIKRIFRECVRDLLKRSAKDVDIIFFIGKISQRVKFKDVKVDIEKVLLENKIIK